jgi:large subunit ribosomal protein L13
MKTIFPKPTQIERKWYIVDAEGKRIGRIASKVASVLRGKHKPEYMPHMETGDYVIIINAEKAVLTGRKMRDKMYYRHSGYPGGLSGENYQTVVKRKPTYPMERAVWGMLPNGPLGRKMYKNLKIYAGPKHPHAAQKPEKMDI